ncbi:MAG: DUF1698 domain-containing protein [Ilumatobacteraceae bacterium]
MTPESDAWWDLLPFTTHRIELAPDRFTADAGVDAVRDIRTDVVVQELGGDLAGKTAVDLGCLEGGFTLEFARRGAERAVGVEARQLSVDRCELARSFLGLDNAEFVCADIKDELVQRAPFDVVFAAGILYHVGSPGDLLVTMRQACRGVALIDTHVAREDAPSHNCSALVERQTGPGTYRGRMFDEYAPGTSDASKEELLWAAWSDTAAFWPLEEELVRMIGDAGFSSVEKVEVSDEDRTRWGVDQLNRVIYVARV